MVNATNVLASIFSMNRPPKLGNLTAGPQWGWSKAGFALPRLVVGCKFMVSPLLFGYSSATLYPGCDCQQIGRGVSDIHAVYLDELRHGELILCAIQTR